MDLKYTFKAKIWQYSGKDPWHFITIPKEYTNEIRTMTSHLPNKGFGTIKVKAHINGNDWNTSIFPDKKRNSYLMPVKKAIRDKLRVTLNETLSVSIQLIDI